MDALCLFDESSRRVAAVNASWSQLFGFSAIEAAGIDVCRLAWAPEEFRTRLEHGAARELNYRGGTTIAKRLSRI